MVKNGNNFTAELSNSYRYALSQTPQIDSVFPNRGGTGGGTRITIIGSGFT